MTYVVKYTSAFKKSYNRMQKRGLDISLLDGVIDTLRRGEKLDDRFRDHGLTGALQGFRECHVKPDWLLIYLIEKNVLTLTLVDTGSHSDLFGA